MPKTLFGEKYVSLVVPHDDPSPTALPPGATIPHTEVPVEVQKVLADLYPLLRTVQPADINLPSTRSRPRSRDGARRSAATW